MAAGRCAGCGCTDSARKIGLHVMTCPQYIELYRCEPGRCLDPEAEYQRYRTEEDTAEARAHRRHLRLRDSFAETQARQALQAARWRQPRDILDD